MYANDCSILVFFINILDKLRHSSPASVAIYCKGTLVSLVKHVVNFIFYVVNLMFYVVNLMFYVVNFHASLSLLDNVRYQISECTL